MPLRALVISVGALAAALLSAGLDQQLDGALHVMQWTLALIPALLLAYHRRWAIVTVLLAVGMAILALAPVVAFALDRPIVDWPFSLLVLASYIGIALGGGWLSEVRVAMGQLTQTQERLRSAYDELTRSHGELQKAYLHMVRSDQLNATGRLAAGSPTR